MGRFGLFAAILLAAGVGGAVAVIADSALAPNPLEGAFGNTVKITGSDGEALVYFNRDGTFTAQNTDGAQLGTWKIVGDKVCTRTKKGGESCGVVQPDRRVGDRWVQALDGDQVSLTIVVGR